MDDTVGVSKNPNAWRIVFQSLAKRSSNEKKSSLKCLSILLFDSNSELPRFIKTSGWFKMNKEQQRSIKTLGIIMASDGS